MVGFRIKTVARVTGLSPEVLRAWERRYGVVSPQRTPGGYREYSEEDVERLRLLRVLTSRGWSIGEIAGRGTAELDRMVRKTREDPEPAPAAAPRGHHAAVVEQLVSLAAELDGLGLRRALRRVLVLMPDADLSADILLPTLAQLATRAGRHRRYRTGLALAVAEIRGITGALGTALPSDAPLALVAPGPLETSGLESLLAVLRCVRSGWQVVAPERGVPTEQLQELVRVGGANLVVLTFEAPVELGSFLALVDSWLAMLPPSSALVVVGRSAELYARAVTERGARFAVDEAALGVTLVGDGDDAGTR